MNLNHCFFEKRFNINKINILSFINEIINYIIYIIYNLSFIKIKKFDANISK